jgi:3-keto-L-gulonate-6-phosphate decarboxylase
MVVPPHVGRHKIRDIRSAHRHRAVAADPKVIDLHAYSGRNVLRFPGGPTPAA